MPAHPTPRRRFNSRARVGATHAPLPAQTTLPVSIHAPGWARHPRGVTKAPQAWGFNSRARVGATNQNEQIIIRGNSFNSRARVGATRGGRATRAGGRVSIHAPGWARRRALPRRPRHRRGFNSRARVGATTRPRQPHRAHRVSIHAPGWARLAQALPAVIRDIRFNSRARVGATGRRLRADRRRRSCFNSRARVGATCRDLKNVFVHKRFQFTRPGGRDNIDAPRGKVAFRFQFTRPGGRDSPRRRGRRKRPTFQFTRPGGRDASWSHGTADGMSVSIHAPGWARHWKGTVP